MQLVFLSPDAEDDLEEIDPSKTYVLCGIIDRIQELPNMSLNKAQSLGAQAKRLPLRKYLLGPGKVPTRSKFEVLRTDMVFAMVLWRAHLGNWTDAFNRAAAEMSTM